MAGVSREVKEMRETRVRSMTAEGKTLREIADILGITPRTVVRIRTQRLGIRIKEMPAPYSQEELATAESMLQEGMSYAEVSRTLGRAHTALARKLPGYSWTQEQKREWVAITRQRRELGVL